MGARVFISCGQRKETDETEIAGKIAQVLEGLGYEPYIAGMEQTLKGVTDNIFRRLSESEYFLFIDFKREEITEKGSGMHRGSLFSHQELAIAAFLGRQVISFQEKGVLKLDGIIAFLQANSTQFEKRSDLPHLVAAAVVTKKWDAGWRHELEITRDETQHTDETHVSADHPGQQYPVTYFHLKVRNRNKYQTAFNCYAYLVKAERLSPKREELELSLVEYKWRGVAFPNVIIPPSGTREIDAFFVYHWKTALPRKLLMGAMSDSPKHKHQLDPGEYHLTFAVRSENFPETLQTFYLGFDGDKIENIVFKVA